jgi:uncharacterized lipoprotein YddW (UPF0748 family)
MGHLTMVAIAQSVPPDSDSSLVSTIPTTELRGVWLTNIDSDVLFSRDNLDEATQRLNRLHFNTIYPTVWNGGYTLYPSAVAERVIGQAVDPHPGLQGRDMLAEAVELGHRQGLAVIPWFEFGLMAPADSELARRHPDWLTHRRNEDGIVMEGEFPRVWLNPAHPEVQQFFVDLIGEVAASYDIDGIQFDDHFGMPFELGYDDYTVQLYQQQHEGRLPPDDPRDPEWINWRSVQLTRLLVKVFFAAKNAKPDCFISLSPNPRLFSYQTFLQDWLTWERLGFLDELVVQVYRTDINRFIWELERPELALVRQQTPVSVGILTGLRILPIGIQQIEEQVQTSRDRQFSGVSFFFYETLGDRDAAFEQLFPIPAVRPAPIRD